MMNQKRILLLEDNLLTARGLQYLLQQEGYMVELVATVNDFWDNLAAATPQTYALAILDVSLPDGDGFRLAEKVRESERKMPMIFLTARDDEADIVRGLELGAEDYITKPFRNRELVARVNAVWRRSRRAHDGQDDKLTAIGPFWVDPKTSEIFFDRALAEGVAGSSAQKSTQKFAQKARQGETGRRPDETTLFVPLDLTALERKLLNLLLDQPGRVVTRERLLDEIWNASGSIVNDNTISVYLRRLRKKLPLPGMIETVKNLGYRLKIPNYPPNSTAETAGAKKCGED